MAWILPVALIILVGVLIGASSGVRCPHCGEKAIPLPSDNWVLGWECPRCGFTWREVRLRP